MNKKNVLIMALALVLVAAISVGGTIAWLTAQTEVVTNTFAVGKIEIDLDEADVDDDDDDNDITDRDKANDYTVIPGDTVAKDPTVTVKETSEKCYVYVSIKNELVINNEVVGTYNIDTTEWTLVGTVGDNTKVYAYGAPTEVDAATEDKELVVFTSVTIDGTKVTDANINTLAGKTIVIDAYAHQSVNTNAATATTAALAHFGATAVSTGN